MLFRSVRCLDLPHEPSRVDGKLHDVLVVRLRVNEVPASAVFRTIPDLASTRAYREDVEARVEVEVYGALAITVCFFRGELHECHSLPDGRACAGRNWSTGPIR